MDEADHRQTLAAPERLRTLHDLGLLESGHDEVFDRFARLAARLADAPVALVNFVDAEYQRFRGSAGTMGRTASGEPGRATAPTAGRTEAGAEGPAPGNGGGHTVIPAALLGNLPTSCPPDALPLDYGFCPHVVARGSTLAIGDLRADPAYRDNPTVTDLGMQAYLGMPLQDGSGLILGTLCVLDRRPRTWHRQILADLQDLAHAVEAEVRLRQEAARNRHTAITLQRSLFEERPQQPDSLRVAGRYVTGTVGTEVGGDWYDAIPLGFGRTALVVGDVMGRGVHAAAVMGQLRTAVRAYANLDLSPGEVLERLDDLVQDITDEQIITCVYAVHDPVAGEVEWANAGHLPPLVVEAAGGMRRLSSAVGAPLGVQAGPFTTSRTALPRGAVLALFTDGLVERRDRDIDAGLRRLGEVLSGAVREADGPDRPEVGADAGGTTVDAAKDAEVLDGVCGTTMLRMIGASGGEECRGPGGTTRYADDDAALLLARVPSDGCPDGWRGQASLPREPASASAARRFARGLLAGWEVTGSVGDDIELVVSELVSNALRHGAGEVLLRLLRTERHVHVEVHDAGTSAPRRRRAAAMDESGRGLRLIADLGQRWGTRHTAGGKAVWCQFSLPAGQGAC
ncbi:ATP-binding SpoIIE family protein phosphatase [Allostreptomyces psammosilenae]|uniref:GAF domain-containing protein/anti-sigma regulatory factor (Ser/Thr protein kinase) n=1 Tax=Allostreptomyces psammosilenae TaxID=1892865 RepID=A0A852ZT89_9ACTN|nr:SpoIIE family protein phosphatase [Allostreptomyces psammosilenae]NYI05055.1 GAF domain-containing protein/anti-sigma regulatory factor (Ser/Thr protein kinase) [Allostreptomyces psammosilenae]